MGVGTSGREELRRGLFGSRVSFDDLEHVLGAGRLFEGLSQIPVMEKLGDVGEGVKVFLKLALGHQEKHDQFDRLVIEGIEIHAAGGTSQSANDFANQIGRGMRDADAKSNARAHGPFALAHDGDDGIAMLRLDLATGNQDIDQFINGLPPVGRLELNDDLLLFKDIRQCHKAPRTLLFRLKDNVFSSRI